MNVSISWVLALMSCKLGNMQVVVQVAEISARAADERRQAFAVRLKVESLHVRTQLLCERKRLHSSGVGGRTKVYDVSVVPHSRTVLAPATKHIIPKCCVPIREGLRWPQWELMKERPPGVRPPRRNQERCRSSFCIPVYYERYRPAQAERIYGAISLKYLEHDACEATCLVSVQRLGERFSARAPPVAMRTFKNPLYFGIWSSGLGGHKSSNRQKTVFVRSERF